LLGTERLCCCCIHFGMQLSKLMPFVECIIVDQNIPVQLHEIKIEQ